MMSVAAWLLSLCGAALVVIGGYFILARPPLLPEDARYIGSPAGQILEAVPGLALWLRRVFWVMGGYIATTGILVLSVANTGLRAGDAGALGVLALGSATSPGWMAAVNFMLGSDFRWALLGLESIWVGALLLGLIALSASCARVVANGTEGLEALPVRSPGQLSATGIKPLQEGQVRPSTPERHRELERNT